MRMRAGMFAAAGFAIVLGGYLLARRQPPRPQVIASQPAPIPPTVPSGPVGSIEGEVDFTGALPPAGQLHREADPFCAHTPMTDPTVLVKDGKLANVWVHVLGGPDAPAPVSAVEMNQKDCMYSPRVATAVVGQKIVARNGDPILHNVHAYLDASTLFNRGMPNDKAAPIEFTAAQEGMIKWKCDVHPWMRGYLGVSRSGLQAVTGETGTFRIENVPPGRYRVEAWQEKFGARTQQVTVDPGKPARIVFSYDGS